MVEWSPSIGPVRNAYAFPALLKAKCHTCKGRERESQVLKAAKNS